MKMQGISTFPVLQQNKKFTKMIGGFHHIDDRIIIVGVTKFHMWILAPELHQFLTK
jgi:hypothetical protein